MSETGFVCHKTQTKALFRIHVLGSYWSRVKELEVKLLEWGYIAIVILALCSLASVPEQEAKT